MALSKEFVQSVRARIAKVPGMPTALLAAELNAPEAQVIISLPVAMRTRADTAAGEKIWNALRPIKGVRLWWPGKEAMSREAQCGQGESVQDECFAVCASRKRGKGKAARQDLPLDSSHIGSIWFVQQPRMEQRGVDERCDAQEECAVRFFDVKGDHLLSLVLPEKERAEGADGRVPEMARDIYEKMRKEFGIIPRPKLPCAGCCHCTCNSEKRCSC